MRKLYIILGLINCYTACIDAQDTTASKLTLGGYLSFMQSTMDGGLPDKKLLNESLLHNRLNLNYYPSSNWSFSLQVRNRLIMSDRVSMDNGQAYKDALAKDMGVIDLSWNALSGRSFVFNTTVDRLWMKYTVNKLEITIGRQRVNWGQTYVWNPNDWFNNYSFFDVDYMERPGSDAFRIKYYTSEVSGLEAVMKLDSTGDYTIAGLFKMNVKRYDLQFLGGVLAKEDMAMGFGWAGGIGQIGFRGEMSYIHPLNHLVDTSGLFLLSVALDYTFANSLMIQVEGLYNQLPGGSGEKNFTEFYSRPLSVKDLSFTELNFFVQIGYPFSPLLSGSLAVLYFPGINGYYAGPAITWSLRNNFDLSLFVQHFSGVFAGDSGTRYRQNFTLGFLRIKFSF